MSKTTGTCMYLETPNEIEAWLDKRAVKNYTINPDLSVDVNGGVFLCERYLNFIPFKFNVIHGHFNVSGNELTTFHNFPHTIEGDFDIAINRFKSLEGCPQNIQGDFDVSYNLLESLVGAPNPILGNFKCNDNRLTTLLGAPSHVGRGFWCNTNQLVNLKFSPQFVGESFYCMDNQLENLEFCPQTVKNEFYCWDNKLLGSVQDTKNFAQAQAHQVAFLVAKEKRELEEKVGLPPMSPLQETTLPQKILQKIYKI